MTIERAAIVVAGTVENIIKVDGANLPDIAGLHLLPAGAPVSIGWTFDGDDFVPAAPPPEPDLPTTVLKARAAAKRWEVETGGIVVAGTAVDTSRESQAMISGAYAYVQAVPSATVDFKAATGWVSLDAAAVTAVALAVAAHVQACFAAERAVSTAIDAGSITDLAGLEAAGWPTNG